MAGKSFVNQFKNTRRQARNVAAKAAFAAAVPFRGQPRRQSGKALKKSGPGAKKPFPGR